MRFSNSDIFNVFEKDMILLNSGVSGDEVSGSIVFITKTICFIVSFYCLYLTASNLSQEQYYRALFTFFGSLAAGLAINISQIIVS